MVLHDGRAHLTRPMFGSPQEEATRLIASVAVAVKTISSLRPALRNFATLARPPFIGFGRRIGEVMQPAMHIGVLGLVGLGHAVEHRIGLCADAALSR